MEKTDLSKQALINLQIFCDDLQKSPKALKNLRSCDPTEIAAMMMLGAIFGEASDDCNDYQDRYRWANEVANLFQKLVS